eukprot:Nitzschia sp. Nitz4//scaffold4_size323378//254722//256849//NITZ4_000700-RA/size323378-processed-gene-0.304-mRNA-1//1//CDS//3329553519//4106//frame0
MNKDTIRSRLEASLLVAGNEKCCDCGDVKPTWASIMIPPKGSPFGSPSIGGFCCMNCSGIHRGLGTHICFVRSVTLDEWKESEVQAMEYGGNQTIQSIFGNTHEKLSSKADLATRNEFIRRKYIGLEFFDPKGYSGIIGSNVPATIAPPPDRLNRRGMMSRQASMPALHASKGMNVGREMPSSSEKLNESCNAFATTWEAFPPSSSQLASSMIPTKKSTKSNNHDLSTSWHPRSPTENIWVEKIRSTPRVPSSRREHHCQTRSKQRSGQSSDLSGDGRDGLVDGSDTYDFDVANEPGSKSDDEIGDSSRGSSRRAIRGRRGEIIRGSNPVPSTRQGKRVGSNSAMAASSEKDALISKLKECLAGDAKDSEEKLQKMAKALDEAQRRKPSDSENGRRSRNNNRLSVSEHGRRRSVSRKRGVRRMKSSDEQHLSIETNEVVSEKSSSPRIGPQNKSSSPRRERRSGQRGDRSRSKSRDARRRGSQRPKTTPNQNDAISESARESVDGKHTEKPRRAPSRSGSGSRRKSPQAGNTGKESKEDVEKSRRLPRRSGSGSGSRSGRRKVADAEPTKDEPSQGWSDFPKSPQGDMDTGFGGDEFSLVASMKPSKATAVVRKQVKSDLWKANSTEESDDELFSDFEDTFDSGNTDPRKGISEPMPIMKDVKCTPAVTPNVGSLDISALTFYS